MMGTKCSGLFLIIWTVLLQSKAYGAETKPKSFTVCENGQSTIRCQEGEVNIVDAFFGRENKKTCPDKKGNGKCVTGGVKPKVARECFRKDTCTLEARTSVFGDSCARVSKYLQVKYTCKDYPKYLVICDKYQTTLKCPKNFQVEIVSAFYGRSNQVTCYGGKVSNTRCRKNVKAKLTNICKGNMECDVEASSTVFGNPCQKTSKYLELKYKCTHGKKPMVPKPSEPVTKPVKIRKKHVRICDGGKKKLICYKKYGGVIEVLKATYGGSHSKNCPDHAKENVETTSCKPIHMTSTIKRKCDDKNVCSVSIPNKQFPDPCPETPKQADITYYCRKVCTKAQFKCKSDKSCVALSKKCDNNDDCRDRSDEQGCPTATTTQATVGTTVSPVSKGKHILICEEDDRSISCNKKANLVINITKALYGRNTIRKCSGIVGTIKCGPKNVTREVKKQCNGKNSCKVTTPVKDPCKGTSKYFEISYECIEKN